MLKSDFSNYTGLYGRGNYLARELLLLVEHGEKYPMTALQLLAKFNADQARVRNALTAALGRLPAATSLVLLPATATVIVAATRQLTATTTPSPAQGTTTYVSSAPGIATVDISGLVTGIAAGTVTITATRGTATDTTVITVTAS